MATYRMLDTLIGVLQALSLFPTTNLKDKYDYFHFANGEIEGQQG